MTRLRPLAVLVTSLLALLAVLAAWAWWPEGGGRADLAAVAPLTPSSSVPARDPATALPSTTTTTAPMLAPSRLVIPAIGVDTTIVPVGLAGDGTMEIPPAAEVGWYELGPSPGSPGSAVLAGHIDFDGERGAFFALGSVPVGAEIVVEGDGADRRFVVTARDQIPKSEVDLGRYFTRDGPNRLTLITCGGAFDRGAGHYQDNIVITATLEPAT